MANVIAYKEYFEQLATLNKILLHDPATPGKTAFTFFSQDDVIANKLKTAIGPGACLHLHMYEWRMKDNNAFDLRKLKQGAFMITKQVKNGDPDSVAAAYDETEVIADDIINKMMADFYANDCKNLVFGIPEFEQLEVTPVGPLWTNRYGWYVTWPFLTKRKPGTPDEIAAAAIAAFNLPANRIFENQFESQFE